MRRICFLTDSFFTIGGVQRVTAVIAKHLCAYYDVTIVSFDNPQILDTSIFGLSDCNLHYRFCSFPAPNVIRNFFRKAYSYIYKKLMLQNRIASDLYAYSSFPTEYRIVLLNELKRGNYDVIIGVHAPLASRLATLKKDLPKETTLIGWIHNSFEALFSESSLYIGANRKRHYVYQFRKLDHVVLLCHHDAKTYYGYDPVFKPTVIYNPLTLKPGKTSQGNTKRFLAVGRFSHRHKGFDMLIEAFHIFAQKNSEWHLDIVGEGVEEKMYRELNKPCTRLLLSGTGLCAQFAMGRIWTGISRGYGSRASRRIVGLAYQSGNHGGFRSLLQKR